MHYLPHQQKKKKKYKNKNRLIEEANNGRLTGILVIKNFLWVPFCFPLDFPPEWVFCRKKDQML